MGYENVTFEIDTIFLRGERFISSNLCVCYNLNYNFTHGMVLVIDKGNH